MTEVQNQDDVAAIAGARRVQVTYYTDPYCSWCWAVEPSWLRLREAYGHAVGFKIVMGGLVESAAPMMADDGQQLRWLQAHMTEVAARSGQPINARFIDDIDASFSTWPACIHVKAAQLQSEDLGERFLRRLRRAAMMEKQAISDSSVAARLADDVEGLEPTTWVGALADGTALEAFLADRRDCVEKRVRGFPTFIITTDQGAPPRVLMGYRPYPELERALTDAVGGLVPRPPRDVVDLLFDHGPLTTREIQEIQGTSPREAIDELDHLVASGDIESVSLAGGTLWQLVADVSSHASPGRPDAQA